MAITTAQKIALFDVLECPYDGTVDKPTDEFNLSGVTYTSDNPDYKLQTKINDRLSSLTSEEEDVLVNYIAQWQLIGSNVASVEAGSIGGVNGVTYDPTHHLMRIQKSVKNLIPVMRYRKEITLGLEREKAGSMNLESIR
jgi:hypothetical protein